MWPPNTKSIKIRVVILVAMTVSFLPVSYLWYGALTSLDCNGSIQNHVVADLNYKQENCVSKTSSHWAIFYGFNAVIYGVPLVTLILKPKKDRSI
ncbi:MAG: hypothetical protein KGH86_08435 [Thaumarchaeota archaeon]|nr:hypothetical protein [Nitrososphaerota archaeon]MDE1876831.1 hypothetical protein [Nitrososphaerota archaeon]